jgi:hypothetical protein
MSKQELNSILLVNAYFTDCRLKRPTCAKTDLVRRYLMRKIDKALYKREVKPLLSNKALVIFSVLLFLLVS